MTQASNPQGGAPAPAEDRPPARRILLLFGLLVLLLGGVLLGVNQLYQRTVRHQQQVRDLAVGSAELGRLQQRDQQVLTTYAVEDEAAGRYRIPITEAMAWLLREPQRIRPLIEPSPPAPEPAPPALEPAPAMGEPAAPATEPVAAPQPPEAQP